MKFGHFDDVQREYVITRPDTPLPWINYLGHQGLIGLISNTASGYTFFRAGRLGRAARFRLNNIPLDTGGRWIYLRDQNSGEFWSPTGQPIRTPLDEYSCRHGLGYTIIESRRGQIRFWARFFIPPGANVEAWQIRVTNTSEAQQRISAFAAVEFSTWDDGGDTTGQRREPSLGEVEVEKGVIYHKTEYRERRDHFAFFTSFPPAAAYDTSRDLFLGADRGWELPVAVEQGRLRDSLADGEGPIGALQVDFSLHPGETRQAIFLLGYHENDPLKKFDPPGSKRIDKNSVRPVIELHLHDFKIEQAIRKNRHSWAELLDKMRVRTPDPHTDRMVNIWNAYQCMAALNSSRPAPFFETGIGPKGGTQLSSQALIGCMHLDPKQGRAHILELAATRIPAEGTNQPTSPGQQIEAEFHSSEEPLWLVLAVSAYIKETGDFSILEEVTPGDAYPSLTQPLFDSLLRSLRRMLDRAGPHGLPSLEIAVQSLRLSPSSPPESPGEPLQSKGHREIKGVESVYLGGLFVLAAGEMAEIAHRIGRDRAAAELLSEAQRMGRVISESGWDGSWFLWGYGMTGEPLGSQANRQVQIFVEPQGMCGMAGIGLADGRLRQALDSVPAGLTTGGGILPPQPAYTNFDPNLGEITGCPPGYQTNAGFCSRTNAWIAIAEARLGRGDRAFAAYLQTNPSHRESISEVHRSEPYVCAREIAGSDAPTHGEASNSWLSSSAAWSYLAVTQWILGIRPTLDGLIIEPVIPPEWAGFSAERVFRGVTYLIKVERVGKGNQAALTVDGREISGTVVPLPAPDVHEVRVKVSIS